MDGLRFLHFALGTARSSAATASTFAVEGLHTRPGNNFLGYSVGFLLVSITGLTDAQLGLDDAGLEETAYCLVPDGALKAEERVV
jgi:hypothetical protein